MKRLTDEIILQLYKEMNTPPHVRAHCRGVTSCAMNLAKALMEADPQIHLDTQLIYGAGMVHDMARCFDAHEIVAADKLIELGYAEEAQIVREHMRTMEYHDIDHVTEADLLYISDRMVQEDTFVGVEKRFDYLWEKMRRHGKEPLHSAFAIKNRKNAADFTAAIEKKTGKDIFTICNSAAD